MTKPRKAKLARSLTVPIIGDAAMAGQVADGRLLPVLILDTSARPEVEELIRVHAHLPGGEATSEWGTSRDRKHQVILVLRFTQPMDVDLILEFSIDRHALIIETMLTGGGVYLQAGADDDRLSTKLDAPRVLVDLPDAGFRKVWDKLLLDRMKVVMARRLGVPRKKAGPHAEHFIAEMRRLAGLRIAQR